MEVTLKSIRLFLFPAALTLLMVACVGGSEPISSPTPYPTYTPVSAPTPEVVAKEMVGTIALMFVIVVAWFVAWVLELVDWGHDLEFLLLGYTYL